MTLLSNEISKTSRPDVKQHKSFANDLTRSKVLPEGGYSRITGKFHSRTGQMRAILIHLSLNDCCYMHRAYLLFICIQATKYSCFLKLKALLHAKPMCYPQCVYTLYMN